MSKVISPKAFTILMAVASLAVVSCGGIKPSTSDSGKKYYESFYAGDGTTRYFIKPMELESDDETMLVDFNVESNKGDTASANFSILSEGPLKNIEHIEFANGDIKKVFDNVQKMFIELEKRNYESRYSVTIPNEDLKSVFADHNWTVVVKASDQTLTFTPKRKTQKKIVALNKAVFMLVE